MGSSDSEEHSYKQAVTGIKAVPLVEVQLGTVLDLMVIDARLGFPRSL